MHLTVRLFNKTSSSVNLLFVYAESALPTNNHIFQGYAEERNSKQNINT